MTDQPVPAAERPEDYERSVQRMADAIHETCRLEWQAIAVADPGRMVTQHMADAHYGQAHDLVRRYGVLAPAPTAPAGLGWAAIVELARAYRPSKEHPRDGLEAERLSLLCEQIIASPSEEPGLDVERLARAIRFAELKSQMDAEHLGAQPAETGPMPDWYRAYAAEVAAEYARLAKEPE